LCRNKKVHKDAKNIDDIIFHPKKITIFVKNWIDMAEDFQQRIERISNKAKLLTDLYAVLRQEKQAADSRIVELTNQVEAQRQEIEQLTQQLEYLKIATTIVPDRQQVENSRAMLIKLVREIDKCIQELNE